MKKYITSFVLLGTFAFHGFSQSTKSVAVDSREYEQMKQSGTFPAGIKITNPQTFTPSLEDLKRVGVVHNMNAASATSGCSCYITPDGTYTLAMAPNDDGSTSLLNIPFTFCLYGTNYSNLYVNNNGNISFGTSYSTFSSNPFPDPSFVMVAPFWGDVDTRGTGTVKYKITPTAMYINWDHVGYYSSMTDKVNTFQLIITDGTDPILPPGNNIAFCYGDMQWTTGAASSGVGGFGGVPATVGMNKGDGVNYLQLGRFDQPGLAYDGGYGANDGVSWLDNQSFYFNSCSSTNIAPIASGLNNCDTIRVCGTGDTLILNGLFLAPEIGQNTTINVDLHGMPGATILANTPGNSADAEIEIIASPVNAGNNVITFTATDNGTPVGTTVVNVNVFIDTTGLAAFNPHISGVLEFCEGSSTTLSVAPTTYDSYAWNTGSTATSITVDTSGLFYVTSVKNNCHKTTSVHVIEHPKPTPVIAGYHYTCGGTTSLYSDSLIYTSYVWSTGSTNDSINVGLGTYTLTVTDTNGCTATSPAVTVTAPVAPVITGITAVCNGDMATLTTTTPYVSYNWSTTSTNDSVNVPGGTYTVSVVDINGCPITSAPFTVNAFNYTLTASGVAVFCANDSILLTAAGTPAAGASYAWSDGAAIAGDYVNTGGNYTVTLTYPNGCSADTTLTVPAPIPAPTPVITGPLFTCGAGSTTLTIDSASLYTGYTWSDASTGTSVVTSSGTYYVTVTGANGCTGTSPAVTVINASPAVTITGNTNFCPGDSAVLFANVNLPSGANYLWSNSATTSSIVVHNPGTYGVGISYSNGCATADTITVSQYGAPHANFTTTPLGSANLGTITQFTDLSTIPTGTIVTWLWNFGDSLGSNAFTQNPAHQYGDNGTYHVTLAVQSNNGCWDTVRFDYTIFSDVMVPNVFTPNGDGKNDYLAFKNLEFFPGSALTVYNRWGNKIYESSDYKNDWAGGGHNDGVYYYVLSGPLLKQTKTGYVQILTEK
ncbi:MAG: hypothetical protein JWP12_1210 [Bacteroidetes bacterium]|nr:hypothetical protein [Bacteroidota bacterium]